jgi:hypothetical protein
MEVCLDHQEPDISSGTSTAAATTLPMTLEMAMYRTLMLCSSDACIGQNLAAVLSPRIKVRYDTCAQQHDSHLRGAASLVQNRV